MEITIALKLQVTPGTMTTAEEITADATETLKGNAMMLGGGFGPLPYTVEEVTAS